jgi:transposase-like protein
MARLICQLGQQLATGNRRFHGIFRKTQKDHRFPTEIISRAVWLYFRFCLSFRDVEELLFERGVRMTYTDS